LLKKPNFAIFINGREFLIDKIIYKNGLLLFNCDINVVNHHNDDCLGVAYGF